MPTIGPVVEQLPTAPNRGMSSSTYPIIADAWAAKIGPWTTQVNAVTTWMGQKVDLILTAQDAANQDAADSEASAVRSEQQVGLAAQQVELAVTARQGAETAQASTVALAAAVAAGALPAFVDGLDVLQSKADKSGVQWGKVGQAVGDVLVTSRIPDATYILPDTVYTRAVYPELFAIVGTQGDKNDGANFTSSTKAVFFGVSTFNMMHMAAGKDGVVIAVGYNTALGNSTSSLSGYVMRSPDFGATWAVVSTFTGGYACFTVDTDNAGVWCIIDYNSKCRRSADNGLTWSAPVAVTGLVPVTTFTMACNRKGVWIVFLNANTDYLQGSRSVDNGLTWQQITIAQGTLRGIYADYSTGDFWLAAGQYTAYKTVNGGLPAVANAAVTWDLAFFNNSVDSLGLIAINAGVIAFVFGPNLYITRDGGATYKVVFGVTGRVFVDPLGVITVNTNNPGIRWYRSYDYGETWFNFTQAMTVTSPAGESGNYCVMYNLDTGAWLMPYGSGAFYRSTRLYNYDVATQFKTPAHKTPKGFKAYIKGKLL